MQNYMVVRNEEGIVYRAIHTNQGFCCGMKENFLVPILIDGCLAHCWEQFIIVSFYF